MRTLKRFLCWLSGHETRTRFGADSLSLYCPFCSYESRGWVLDRPMPRARFVGDEQMLRMTCKRVIRLRAVNQGVAR